MSWYISDIIKGVSRELRKNMTYSEVLIWDKLKNKKIWYKFLRQKPIYLYTENSWLARYIIPDFICLELKLVLEIDWNVHDKKDVYLLDMEKEKLLKIKWFTILRFKNEQINKNLKYVILKIKQSFP